MFIFRKLMGDLHALETELLAEGICIEIDYFSHLLSPFPDQLSTDRFYN